MHAVIPPAYIMMEQIELQGTQTLLRSFWIDRVWEHFTLYEEGLVRYKICMFASTYFRYQIKKMISFSKLASVDLSQLLWKHPCKTWIVPIFRCLYIKTIYLM